jgi:hypothetical protein
VPDGLVKVTDEIKKLTGEKKGLVQIGQLKK